MDQRLPDPAVAAPVDWRGLCLRMADELDHYRQLVADDRREVHPLAVEARAVLSRYGHPAPAPAGEVGELVQELRNVVTAYKSCHNQDSIWSLLGGGVNARLTVTLLTRSADLLEQRQGAPAAAGDCPACEGTPGPGNQPCAVCGRHAPAAAEEVAELVWWLRSLEDASVWFETGSLEARRLARAADLLERQAAPVPVAVSERLPGVEDCDAEGRCWVHQPHEACPESPAWELMSAKYASANYEALCWLPANSLPLPSGEVE